MTVHIPAWEEIAEDAGTWVGWLTPDAELEESELGERVSDELTDEMFAAGYSRERDRLHAFLCLAVARVAACTSWRELSFPAEWRPSVKDNYEADV